LPMRRRAVCRGRRRPPTRSPKRPAPVIGVGIADYMFEQPLYSWSHDVRAGMPRAISEGVATFGLLSVIWGCSRQRSAVVVPFAVGAYITAAYWFTASTSFANPAVTIARALTDTFAGIRPADVPAFIVAQTVGAAAATILFTWLVPTLPATAREVVVPHGQEADRGQVEWTR
jgi:glycerol uptake facilitator-like aquaporin